MRCARIRTARRRSPSSSRSSRRAGGTAYRLLDLGIGSGLVEEALFERLPDIEVVGIDRSEAMLAQARTRYRGRANLRLVDGGFEDLDSVDARDGLGPPFEFVICVQALHEVRTT